MTRGVGPGCDACLIYQAASFAFTLPLFYYCPVDCARAYGKLPDSPVSLLGREKCSSWRQVPPKIRRQFFCRKSCTLLLSKKIVGPLQTCKTLQQWLWEPLEEFTTVRPWEVIIAPYTQGQTILRKDELLVRLKERDNLSWREIAKHFSGRTRESLQVRYCTTLKH